MDTPEKSKRPRGRPPKEAKTENVPLIVDEATIQKLDALIEYGGFGTSRGQVVLFIIRIWLWEHQTRITTDIAAKHDPYGADKGN